MKKLLIVCSVLLMLLTAYGSNETSQTSKESSKENMNEQIPNPWVEYSSLEEAANAIGFEFEVPEKCLNTEITVIQGITGDLFEVIYGNEANANEASARKGKGSSDVSGDYNTYSNEEKVTVEGIEYTVKSNDSVKLVTWVNGEYSYSLSFGDDIKVSVDEVKELVKSFK